MTPCTARRRALSLVELLVVVAIIAILLAVLLPSLRRARAVARSTKCKTQLREYARGFQYYLADDRDTFPAADYGPDRARRTIRGPTWFELVESYWLGPEVLDPVRARRVGRRFGLGRCPELQGVQESNGIEWRWRYSWTALGYGYNRYFLGWNLFDRTDVPPTVPPKFWRRLIEVRQPAECLLVADSRVRIMGIYPEVGPVGHYLGWRAMARRGSGVDTRHFASGATVPSTYRGQTAYYPDGWGNIAWVDGHVSARTSRQINDIARWQPLWDPEQRTGGW